MIGTHGIVENDLYDIATRVKEIDPAYFIVFHYRQKRFELHAHGQKGGTLALVLPFDRLDARTLNLARKTRAERVTQLIRQMEAENELRQRREIRERIDRAMEAYGDNVLSV